MTVAKQDRMSDAEFDQKYMNLSRHQKPHRMDAKVKAKWLRALPRYEQSQETLCDGQGFCCLGVLYDVHIGEWEYVPPGMLDVTGWHAVAVREDTKRAMGADQTMIFCGHGTRLRLSAAALLTEMNDEGATFEQIGRWIKKYL